MRVIPRRYLQVLVFFIFGWPIVTIFLAASGVSPLTAAVLPTPLLPTHPGLRLFAVLFVVGIWVFGPAWVVWRIYWMLQKTSLMPITEARRLVSEYGHLLEEHRSPSTGDHLPATIEEMDRAIRSVLNESLHSTEALDALRFAYSELASWEPPSSANPPGDAMYQARYRRFTELALEAASSQRPAVART